MTWTGRSLPRAVFLVASPPLWVGRVRRRVRPKWSSSCRSCGASRYGHVESRAGAVQGSRNVPDRQRSSAPKHSLRAVIRSSSGQEERDSRGERDSDLRSKGDGLTSFDSQARPAPASGCRSRIPRVQPSASPWPQQSQALISSPFCRLGPWRSCAYRVFPMSAVLLLDRPRILRRRTCTSATYAQPSPKRRCSRSLRASGLFSLSRSCGHDLRRSACASG
mmetsp:Transcript_21597/g.59361  ORF Transcript_21597/g.59361 Transcript_21597/m.59361 type:complete len:221 (+) Transcript_21597:335-997(+)